MNARLTRRFAGLSAALALTACAHAPNGDTVSQQDIRTNRAWTAAHPQTMLGEALHEHTATLLGSAAPLEMDCPRMSFAGATMSNKCDASAAKGLVAGRQTDSINPNGHDFSLRDANEDDAASQVAENTPDASGFEQTGRASWYGKGFHGRLTASGERFDMYALTAAHRSLPLSSYVRVTNESNHRSIIVKITDRGPFHGKRILDLSYAAAQAIHLRGVAKVTIHGLSRDEAEMAMEKQTQTMASR